MKRVVFALFMVAMLAFGGTLSTQTTQASPRPDAVETEALFMDTIVTEYKWFCYNTPQLTYNLQYVNAALYKRTIVYESYASGRIVYASSWTWVQNAWQWFCPQGY